MHFAQVYVYVRVYVHTYFNVYVYVWVYVYVYDINTVLRLMFLTCTISDFIWLLDFRYCLFLVLHFYSLMFLFKPFLMLLLYLLFVFVFYFTCLYIARNDGNKDVQ